MTRRIASTDAALVDAATPRRAMDGDALRAEATAAIARARAAAAAAAAAAALSTTPRNARRDATATTTTRGRARGSPRGPPRRVAATRDAPTALEIPRASRAAARDVVDSARSVATRDARRTTTRDGAFASGKTRTNENDRASAARPREARAFRRETRARIDETTLEKLLRVAAKARARDETNARDAFDLKSVKEAVEFLSSPRTKTSRVASQRMHPRL